MSVEGAVLSPPPAWFLTLESLSVRQPFANHFRLAEMMAAQGRCGLATTVIAPRGGLEPCPVASLGSEHRGPHAHSLPSLISRRRRIRISTLALGTPGLYRRSLRERPSWIFVHDSLHASTVRRIKQRLGNRVTVHVDVMGLSSLEVELGPEGGVRRRLAQRVYRYLERVLLDAADLITVINDRHAAIIGYRYAPRAPVVTVRDAADPVRLDGLPQPDLAAVGIPPAPHRLVFVGQLMRNRLDGLLSALERVSQRCGVQALIVGDGPDRSAYERRVATSPALRGRVFFVGYLEREKALSLASACPLAFSDCWSAAGFPTKLFEYMALGLAIIVERKPQIGEVLENDRNALFYSTVDELAMAIARLCDDPSLGPRLGSAAHTSFETHHTRRHRRAQLDALIVEHLVLPSSVKGAGRSR
jgi:glycosyltransferase involved in cell wall biosynthesis